MQLSSSIAPNRIIESNGLDGEQERRAKHVSVLARLGWMLPSYVVSHLLSIGRRERSAHHAITAAMQHRRVTSTQRSNMDVVV